MSKQAVHEHDSVESLRLNLDHSLTRSYIDPSTLSPFQRILLTTDGTVTEILEAYLFEPIQIVKLSEDTVSTTVDIPALDLPQGREIIKRKILLQGRISRKNFVYAESLIVPDRLEENFKYELLNTQVPMGRVWREKRMETFKEIIDSALESAEHLSEYFQLEQDAKMLSRTYQVFSASRPIMIITEKFPESYFVKAF